MKTFIQYGDGNERTYEAPDGSTIGSILRDPRNQAALGYGDNVEAHVGGMIQSGSTPSFSGIRISVHDKACAKQTQR